MKQERTNLFLMAAIVVVAANLMLNLALVSQPILEGPAGAQTGTARVQVQTSVCLNLGNNDIDFGALFPDDNDNTTDGDPVPFSLINCGNVNENYTIQVVSPPAESLWEQSPFDATSVKFQYLATENETGSVLTPVDIEDQGGDLQLNYTNVPHAPDAAETFAGNVLFGAANDQVNVHINITVPDAEPAGSKIGTLTFVASQA